MSSVVCTWQSKRTFRPFKKLVKLETHKKLPLVEVGQSTRKWKWSPGHRTLRDTTCVNWVWSAVVVGVNINTVVAKGLWLKCTVKFLRNIVIIFLLTEPYYNLHTIIIVVDVALQVNNTCIVDKCAWWFRLLGPNQ